MQNQQIPFDESTSLWEEVNLLFRAVDKGKAEWGVPAYDGGLFSTDKDLSPAGALLETVSLQNTILGHVLRDLLLIHTVEGWGPVDFRTLNVGEFGTIYQGLLESELAIADTDLTLDERGFYRPCLAREEPLVKKNRIYLHDRSGARKATGTYFTKEFAVAHLLDHVLEPALADHCKRLDVLDEHGAAEAFFDFRIADIAMGSAHFLVAAVDRIERVLTDYLARRSLPEVRHELERLRAAAQWALGTLAETVEIEDTQLVRRLITRRCIYGVDRNPIAVALARLSLWIHSFVPGLPLSLLDRNLVTGNSLVGIGQLEEIKGIQDKARGDDLPLFSLDPVKLIGETMEPLRHLMRLADASTAELGKARRAMEQAKKAAKSAEALCDIVTAARMQHARPHLDLRDWDTVKKSIVGSKQHKEALNALAELQPFHFPIAFPEVFLWSRRGFDVIIGNPPWQEATLEEHGFWSRHFAGFRGMPQREQEKTKASLKRKRPDLADLYDRELAEAEAMRKALVTGPYPGMGTGDPDFYKAFCWRFWHLVCSDGGWIGVVLPRSAFNAKGSTEFRKNIFENANPVDITMLLNQREWVFPDVHEQYCIGLLASSRSAPTEKSVRLRGPFASLDRFRSEGRRLPTLFNATDVLSWTDTASLPLLPTEDSLAIFTQLRKAPRLDLNDSGSWRARPHRELDATNDAELMDLKSEDRPRGFWPVFKGESFDIWECDTGRYYAWADPRIVIPALQKTRLRGNKNNRSSYSEFRREVLRSSDTLACYRPRIAFRDGTNRLNERTVIAVLVPPKVFLGNQAPFLLWPRGDERDEAYVLGVLCSLPLDWYARRFVERHLNFFLALRVRVWVFFHGMHG